MGFKAKSNEVTNIEEFATREETTVSQYFRKCINFFETHREQHPEKPSSPLGS